MPKFSFDDLEQTLVSLPHEIKQKKMSILLPFYNEKDIIVPSIHTVATLMGNWGWNFEIIASDDGSSDGSSELIKENCASIAELKLIQSHRNYGKGRALASAYEESTGEYILFLDCDLELPLEHLPYFMKKMQDSNADIVIGSKEDDGSDLDYPKIRKLLSLGYSTIIKLLFRLPVKDTQTGIKLFKRAVLETTLPYILVKKFAFDTELLTLAFQKGFLIETHPIILRYTRAIAQGRMGLDTILHMLKDTMAIFWRLKSGFWHNLVAQKTSLNYAIISLDKNLSVPSGKKVFYVPSLKEIPSLLPSLLEFDAIIFLEQEEIPVFSFHALDRIFANGNIQGIYPTLYPITDNVDEELYYAILGNIFFSKCYYPRYRPVRQEFMTSMPKSTLLDTMGVAMRVSFLEQLIKENEGAYPEKISNFNKLVHSPYFFLHSHFPENFKEFREFLMTRTNSITGIKKWGRHIYLFSALLLIVSFFEAQYLFALPVLILEFMLHLWYIYSLGIRKGIKYLWLFDRIRFFNICYTIMVFFDSILKLIKKENK